MSAVFGILRLDGDVASSRDLERMANALAYRGPDGHKVVVEGAVGLGHCLMRVNREDEFDAQPVRDPAAGVVLVADVRLDNREELAAAFDLPLGDLHEMPDSALVMRAYKTWGEDCARHLLGDFAFAIWDGRARKLILARDHMGQRCIHYHCGTDFFVFATDVNALWTNADVPRVLSEAGIGRMLMTARSTEEGETLYQDVRGLPGATVMKVGPDGSVDTQRYWKPSADPMHEHRDEAYYIEAYRRVLGEAVACRIRRVMRPPGLAFSGGYDSAAIAGLAGPALARSGMRLIGAASVMPADYRGTIRHARRWVEMCARDMPHLDVRFVTREGTSVLSGLERAFLESDSAAKSYHFVTSELFSNLAGAGARVIMDGHGGDHTLHPRGEEALARFLATFQFRRFVAEFRGHLRLVGQSPWMTFRKLVSILLPPSITASWRRVRRGFAPTWRDHPINGAFARQLIAEGAVDEHNVRSASPARLDMRGQMASVLNRVTTGSAPKLSLNAALHGLELTRPFHDKRVVELGLAVPQDLYVKDGRSRYLACAALRGVYPPEFQTRWRRNDDEIPDFQRMTKSIEPQLLADVARMEQSEHLSRYVDFSKIRTLLAARDADDHNSGWEQETQLAVHGFVVARYVEWFERHNR